MVTIMGTKILMKEIAEYMDKTASGLFIPQTSQRQKQLMKGEVISFGIDCAKVREGDTIYIDSHTAIPLEFEGEEYILADETTVFAIQR